jgi:hypothetical protein
MDPVDLKSLEGAVAALERPTWAMRIVNLIGMPIEAATKLLPARAGAIVSRATTRAVRKALVAAVSTMGKKHGGAPSKWLHRAAVAGSGGVGGFFGLPGLAVELPISTVIMLRAIADIARSEGEDLDSVEGQLACVQVFALGGRGPADDVSTAYYTVRIASRRHSEAAELIAARGSPRKGARRRRLIARIAARLIWSSAKVAAQACRSSAPPPGGDQPALREHLPNAGGISCRRLEEVRPRRRRAPTRRRQALRRSIQVRAESACAIAAGSGPSSGARHREGRGCPRRSGGSSGDTNHAQEAQDPGWAPVGGEAGRAPRVAPMAPAG